MKQNLLDYFRETNKGFIHPKGEAATELLLKELSPKEGDRVLELGFGTGASLVKAISGNRSVKFYGVEANEPMLKQADSRLRFCGLRNKVILKILNADKSIPFESDFFDIIYAESVLGIQEGEDLSAMILELSRVLKPNGLLCINELVWSSGTAQIEVDAVNEFVKEKFGIIQANGKYKSIQNWIDLLTRHNLEVGRVQNIGTLKNSRFGFPSSYPEFLSNLCSFKGRIRGKLNSGLRNEWNSFKKEMSTLNLSNKLEPYIITACNKKQGIGSTETKISG